MEEEHNEQFEEPTSEELARLAQEAVAAQQEGEGDDPADVRTRCQRVIDLYAKGAILDAPDNFHAALVLLYGEKPAHYDLSRTFARRAASLGDTRSWSAYAMAWDRWLVAVGQPQRFGTQIIKRGGRWALGEIDPTVTDMERALFGVLPLAVQQQRAEQLQRQDDASA